MNKRIFIKLSLTILIFISAINFLYAQAPPSPRGGGSILGLIVFLIIFLFIALFFISIGLTVIASGQIFLAIREIALNTRKEEKEEASKYQVLFTVAKINNIVGWLIMIFPFIVLIARFFIPIRLPF